MDHVRAKVAPDEAVPHAIVLRAPDARGAGALVSAESATREKKERQGMRQPRTHKWRRGGAPTHFVHERIADGLGDLLLGVEARQRKFGTVERVCEAMRGSAPPQAACVEPTATRLQRRAAFREGKRSRVRGTHISASHLACRISSPPAWLPWCGEPLRARVQQQRGGRRNERILLSAAALRGGGSVEREGRSHLLSQDRHVARARTRQK